MYSIIRILIWLVPLVIILAVGLNAQSQTINSKVVSSGGGSGKKGDLIFNSTLGEAVISTKTTSEVYLGQGFQATHPSVLITSVRVENEVLDLKAYPNPFSRELFINGDFMPDRLDIYNMNGQCVGTILSPGSRISDWGELPDGIYVIQGTYREQSFNIGKIIKINP